MASVISILAITHTYMSVCRRSVVGDQSARSSLCWPPATWGRLSVESELYLAQTFDVSTNTSKWMQMKNYTWPVWSNCNYEIYHIADTETLNEQCWHTCTEQLVWNTLLATRTSTLLLLSSGYLMTSSNPEYLTASWSHDLTITVRRCFFGRGNIVSIFICCNSLGTHEYL